MNYNDDLHWESKNFSKIPLSVFSDENIYKREIEKIFIGPVWLFLGLEAEIPNSGDFITNFAGDIPIVVNRSKDGNIYAFVNRCAHRSSTVVRELRGNSKNHTCIYHRWCYNHKGELTGVPYQNGINGKGGLPDDFNKNSHCLKSAHFENSLKPAEFKHFCSQNHGETNNLLTEFKKDMILNPCCFSKSFKDQLNSSTFCSRNHRETITF